MCLPYIILNIDSKKYNYKLYLRAFVFLIADQIAESLLGFAAAIQLLVNPTICIQQSWGSKSTFESEEIQFI